MDEMIKPINKLKVKLKQSNKEVHELKVQLNNKNIFLADIMNIYELEIDRLKLEIKKREDLQKNANVRQQLHETIFTNCNKILTPTTSGVKSRKDLTESASKNIALIRDKSENQKNINSAPKSRDHLEFVAKLKKINTALEKSNADKSLQMWSMQNSVEHLEKELHDLSIKWKRRYNKLMISQSEHTEKITHLQTKIQMKDILLKNYRIEFQKKLVQLNCENERARALKKKPNQN